MNNHFGHSSRDSWSSNTSTYLNYEENEVKPNLANISCGVSDPIALHTVHDFSIHIHNRKEYSSPITPTETDPTYNSLSRSVSGIQRKCSDSFVAKTCCGEKRWSAADVSKVVSIERTFFRTSTLIIRFPDKKISKHLVSKLHRSIRGVNFLQSPFARRCCVTLKDPENRAEVLTMLNSTRFGSGFLSADGNYEELTPSLDDIDPFTLFCDNIPPQFGKEDLIRMFPDSQQITVGYTNKIYFTKRYAFIIFLTIKDAVETFKKINKTSDMLVRFRRFSGSAHLPTSEDIKKCQSGIENSQQEFPIVTDPGPPVVSTERNYKIIHNVTIKTEPTRKSQEIIVDDDDDANDTIEAVNYGPTTDFDKLYENLKQSRLQMSMLRQLE